MMWKILNCTDKRKKSITHLYATDYFWKKKKDDVEEEMTNYQDHHVLKEIKTKWKNVKWIDYEMGMMIYGPANSDNLRLSENIQNIWQNQKLHPEFHGKLEGGIDNRKGEH